MVLPDKDRSDADVVVFLAEEHAAGDDTEAQQRGAVCAMLKLWFCNQPTIQKNRILT